MRGEKIRESTGLPPREREGKPTRRAGPGPSADPEMKKAMAECRRIRAREMGRRPVVRLARPRSPPFRGALGARPVRRGAPWLRARAFDRRPDPR